MYWVPNNMSHLQLIESLSTHIMTFKKRKSQQLINIYAVASESGKKRSNYMTLPSFDSKISHQIKEEHKLLLIEILVNQ